MFLLVKFVLIGHLSITCEQRCELWLCKKGLCMKFSQVLLDIVSS